MRTGLGKRLAAGLALAALVGLAACAEKSHSPHIATVGEQPITMAEFQAQCAFMGLGGKPSNLAPPLREALLETIIQRRIILEQAQARSIRLEPEELDREEASIRRGLSEDAFERTLAAQGIEYEVWRRVLAQELLMHKTLDLLLSGQVQISPEEVRTYYQEHRDDFRRPEQVLAQHALLPNQDLALKLVQRVQAGEEMGRAAADLEVPLADEGEPIWLARGHMPTGLENKVFALEPGKLAGPLASSYGYHVVRVLAKRPASDLDLTQAAEEIQRRLAADKKELLAGSLLEELRAKAQVWRHPGFLHSGQLDK